MRCSLIRHPPTGGPSAECGGCQHSAARWRAPRAEKTKSAAKSWKTTTVICCEVQAGGSPGQLSESTALYKVAASQARPSGKLETAALVLNLKGHQFGVRRCEGGEVALDIAFDSEASTLIEPHSLVIAFLNVQEHTVDL